MAPETTANEKMVFAKSYIAHVAGTIARPLGVMPASPRGPEEEPRAWDGAALVTAR